MSGSSNARFGMTLSSEEHGPNRLVELAVLAEDAGFDFVSISDHFHPWISDQGHSPFVWSVLGAIAQATGRIDVAVGVTCPTIRIHPAILAQAVATTGVMLDGRFTWGVGSGENLNEHVVGMGWPPAEIRQDMMVEAIDVIRRLWREESVTHRGEFYDVEDARIFDLPENEVPIIVSAFGPRAAEIAAQSGDGLWITGAAAETIDGYREAGGNGPVYSQITVCWAEDRNQAVELATRQWPNTGLPGQLAQDLRTVLHFEQAAELVTADIIERDVPCGPDPEPMLDEIQAALDAGVDHLYIHQIGDDQEGFVRFWQSEVAPELKGEPSDG